MYFVKDLEIRRSSWIISVGLESNHQCPEKGHKEKAVREEEEAM
jgi:hypothetical protein